MYVRGAFKEPRRIWSVLGGSGGPPPENFWISGPQVEYSYVFLVNLPQYPYPYPLKKILFRFTLISRMVLGVGKKSEIRLKSEDSVPCYYIVLFIGSWMAKGTLIMTKLFNLQLQKRNHATFKDSIIGLWKCFWLSLGLFEGHFWTNFVNLWNFLNVLMHIVWPIHNLQRKNTIYNSFQHTLKDWLL